LHKVKLKGVVYLEVENSKKIEEQSEENIIEKTCRELGVNQTELALITKIDNANLSRWKSEKRKIPIYIQEYLKILSKLNKHEKILI